MVNTAVILMLCSLTSLSLRRGNEGEATTIRNLYNAITDKIHEFENNCEPPAARGSNKPAFIRLKQPKEKFVEQEKEKSRLVLYPNPASSIVTVKYKNIKQMQIFDIAGRLIKTEAYNGIENNTKLNVSGLHKGVYIIKVISVLGIAESTKLIIN